MPDIPDLTAYIMTGTKYLLPILALWILLRCIRSMLREKYEPETWAWLLDEDGAALPVSHWESIIGRSPSSDIVIDMPSVSKLHASLQRDGDGDWTLSDLRSREGTYINGDEIDILEPVEDGDTVEFGDAVMTFREIDAAERAALERRRTAPGRFVGPGVTLLILSLFQAFLTLEFTITAAQEYLFPICLAFFALMVTEWFCYLVTRSVRRTGFEPETLAFFLTTLGTAVCATATPEDMFRQTIFIILGVALYFFLGAWLRSLERVKSSRFIAAARAGAAGRERRVQRGRVRRQELAEHRGRQLPALGLVKVLYIYTGAATLDRLFARRNLFVFIVFSAICVIALALIGDFGTAVIFFATFLVISFMRSGSFATVFLAVSGAAMAGFLVLSVKPYIAERFASWGHVWEDVWDKGYQQTHALSAAASGGLFGKGAGSGWLKDIFAAETDMVFGVVSEELGLIIAVLAMFAVIALALFAVRNAAQGRSTFYVIAGCAAVSLLMVQMGLNVFGSLDILPFTGVTFPFVSKGGTSLISCWMLLAFVKATDTRRDASFVVSRDKAPRRREDYGDYEDEDGGEEAEA
ncbi:MAG: FtsW/RodA/SpoVE family cell cycle protein [Oscillospiraceae bacterium]